MGHHRTVATSPDSQHPPICPHIPPRNGNRVYGGGCLHPAVSTLEVPHCCPPCPCLPCPSCAAWPQVSGQCAVPGLSALVLLVSQGVRVENPTRRGEQCSPRGLWHEVTALGTSSAATAANGSCRLRLPPAYKIPGQQDLRVDRFYVTLTEIHGVGCKRCVGSTGAARGCGWWWREGSGARASTSTDPAQEEGRSVNFL